MKPRKFNGQILNQRCLVRLNHCSPWYWLLYNQSSDDYEFISYDYEKRKTVRWQQSRDTPQVITLGMFDAALYNSKLGVITDIKVYRNSYEALTGLQGFSKAKNVQHLRIGDVLICTHKKLEEMIGSRIIISDKIEAPVELLEEVAEENVEPIVVRGICGEWTRGGIDDDSY